VACNATNDIVEVDAERWTMLRRIPAGDGVYNLEATPDGRLLVASNKRGRSVSVFDLASGRELGRIETQRPVVHGVAIYLRRAVTRSSRWRGSARSRGRWR
jgi:hypothetical protein